ncbi:MAG: hypothetical protein CMM44_09565 [Rhodospirillaceae bacterium]|nr:hypothetical protein [Rhodospirillaceae bacterium]|tara:strand:- start:3778 stop:4635 length:858 start_codon:yes stop_codon:yes gene_type:complete
MYIARLKERGICSLSGNDTLSFLQGIVTNDVAVLSDKIPCYSALLSPQGKFLHDFFLIQDGKRILIDCNLERCEDFRKRLLMYKLRSDVEIKLVEDLMVFAIFPEAPFEPYDIDNGIMYTDPRNPMLGKRLILSRYTADRLTLQKNTKRVPGINYQMHRIKLGVAEGPAEIEPGKSFPLEFGLQFLNAISFTKGCYIGQEVTTRMNTRKLAKKVPAVIKFSSEIDVKLREIIFHNEKKIGEVRSVFGNHALILISMSAARSLQAGQLIKVGYAEASIYFPDWLDF